MTEGELITGGADLGPITDSRPGSGFAQRFPGNKKGPSRGDGSDSYSN